MSALLGPIDYAVISQALIASAREIAPMIAMIMADLASAYLAA